MPFVTCAPSSILAGVGSWVLPQHVVHGPKMVSLTSMFARIASALIVGVLLQACGSLPRLAAVPPTSTESAVIPGIPNARNWLDRDLAPFIQAVLQDDKRERAALARAGKPTDPLPPASLLAISGGSDAGAFAAGLLVGWTAHGTRPQFRVVTGISAGALIAPFAFLGPRYDDALRNAFTSVRSEDIFRKRSLLVGLSSDGMADSEPLARLVAKHVTPEMLSAVAEEYARGRVLEIGTTDLDSGRPVTWNMGEIASSDAPGALELFRKIIIASTSIPGEVSPVMIDVDVDGKHFQEMHVDGGVITQVFLYPRSILQELQRATGRPYQRELRAYVIRNGRLEPEWSDTERHTLSIGGRAITALIQTQGISDLQRIYLTAQRDGVDFNLAYIGSDFHYPHRENFDPDYMKHLFDYAYQRSAKGYTWHKAPPGEVGEP
jgi:Patatin-like phospholipase